MGYSILTPRHRYTEWVHLVRLGGYRYKPDWDNPCDYGELYDLHNDQREDSNLFRREGYGELVQILGRRLREGWRAELEKIEEN